MVRPGNRIQKLSPRGHFLNPNQVSKDRRLLNSIRGQPRHGMVWAAQHRRVLHAHTEHCCAGLSRAARALWGLLLHAPSPGAVPRALASSSTGVRGQGLCLQLGGKGERHQLLTVTFLQEAD